ALPNGNRATPITISADRPVSGAFEPFSELTVFHIRRNPLDLLINFKESIFQLRYTNKPARDSFVDQWIPASPAMRVTMLIACFAQQSTFFTDQTDQGSVSVHPQFAGNIMHGSDEATAVVEAHNC